MNLKEKVLAQLELNKDKMLKVYIFAIALSYSTKSLLPGYLGYNAAEALSTPTLDGWCNPELQGIGQHCFSDFYNVMDAANSVKPWASTPNPAPPLGLLFFKFFSLSFWNIEGSNVALLVYLSVALVLISITYFCMSDKYSENSTHKFIGFCLLLTCAPLLILIDRANFLIYSIPLHFLLLHFMIQEKYYRVSLIVIFLSLLKPQFVLLSLVLAINRKFKILLQTLIYSSFAFIFSFGLYGGSIISNIKDYLSQISAYQNYTNAGAIYPPNLSIVNFYYSLKRLLVQLFPDISNLDSQGRWLFPSEFITVGILAFILFLFLFGISRRSFASNYFIVVLIPILFTNVSFAYYLACILPILVVYFLKVNDFGESSFTFLYNQFSKVIFLGFILFSFIPWSLPWSIFLNTNIYNWADVSFTWLIAQFLLSTLFFCLIMQGILTKKVPSSLIKSD
jgi:hypothetical protein